MTISELITELQKYPADKQVVIEDADTLWIGSQIHICEDDKLVMLFITYGEMSNVITHRV